ncbi:2-oxoacid:acceptor oxidoreductase subunit alpha [Pinisolibacter aquiterrae]|uniref:2-oxoacid:acceptor oxidoreductase subunit alpha n=1 Tax=Pinisolibacter aquiterrae TaxID=2815579 RepID=UPI001C3E29C0|nr:2-oxoacid:acceptor oxidoreductase subunit alpha [Pinisolibacter aquiterrae]MBV5264510.1 2-oxoacid:acceptor oxidoreductase subunit alpha [Pinisolibacter aquiterrae]MCC8235714.1 2-oxoacid:acceptor oxidoreductase subunit alpha [Pinisolibacter aquiterrae]
MSTTRKSVSIVIAGSGGTGAITAGSTLLAAAARDGHYGLMTKLSGAQVRGGEAAALIEIGRSGIDGPIEAQPDRFDALIALDWENIQRFAPEIPLDGDSVVLSDPKAGPVPAVIAATGARILEVAFGALAGSVEGGRINMVGFGVAARLAGLDETAIEAAIRAQIGAKGEKAVAASLAAAKVGAEALAALGVSMALSPGEKKARWMCSGNDAVGLGALRGGIEFVAAYPITPATEITEWLAVEMQEHGGRVVLAEDEIAAINMCCGAAYAGVPTMTITSGPGLALKVETLGLAIAAELPMVVVDVMRVGPSTGIPTKSDQGDLDIALHGTPGDAPRVVLAPISIADCAATTERAVHVAEALQTPVMLLSDQSLGQTQTIIDIPRTRPAPLKRLVEPAVTGPDFRRYALTESGVSPMPAPGNPGTQWVADGLSHKESGHPSNAAVDHIAQMKKRLRKLETFDWGDTWGEVHGPADATLALIAFGSTVGPAAEAARRLTEAGTPTRVVALRLIAPLQKNRLAEALAGTARVVVVEQNASGQLFRHLLGERALGPGAESFARPGPAPFRAAEIVAHLTAETREAAE